MGTLFLGLFLWILPLIFFNLAILLFSHWKRFFFLVLSVASAFCFVVFIFINKNPELFNHSVFYILLEILFNIVGAVLASGVGVGLVIILTFALVHFLFDGAESLEPKNGLIYPAIYFLATALIIFQ